MKSLKKSIRFKSPINTPLIFLSIFLVLFTVNCDKQANHKKDIVVVGIPSDVATINPLFAFDLQEGHLLDLLYLKPFQEIWNDSLGTIEFKPMIAESYTINNDSNFITLKLRDDLKWSDGKAITVEDIIFSFDIYSDPKVNSRLFGLFENFYSSDDLHIDVQKTFRKNSDKSLTIFFKDFTNFSLLDINHAILPEHLFKGIKKEDVETAELNFNPITSGPFKLYKWDRDQKIHLKIDSTCYLFNQENIQEIVFKIIPDEFSLLTQLKNGEIDLIEDVEPERVKELDGNEKIKLGSIKGRNFDYVGWNNIDPESFAKKQFKPNRYFASAKVRKALSLAINRNEIFQSVIGKYGVIYDSPISPIFKSYSDKSLNKVEYNPTLAKQLLSDEGWKDINGDGILEKGNQKFSFKIYSNTGDRTREYSSTIIKNNLKEIGIDVEIIFVEKSELIDGLLNKKYDAFLSGWTIQIPLNLDNYRNPKSESGMFNFVSYHDERVDSLLNDLKPSEENEKRISTYKNINNIFVETEPVTVLFWSDNIIAFNKRIININFSPLGLFTNTWQWKIEK
jgi:peptide/nickel transport system substrate-binding protein